MARDPNVILMPGSRIRSPLLSGQVRIKLEVFGRLMLAERANAGWQLFDLGPDGKRRLATDVVIPDFVAEDEVEQYLADIFHESATSRHPGVKRLAG